MQLTSFQLRFLSPAFLAGARPKKMGSFEPWAELRSASIIGQLRWWHRFLGKQSSESRIFGSVAGESGTAAGFAIRIVNAPDSVSGATTPESLGMDHSYFLYAQAMDNGSNYRAALAKGSTFQMVLMNRRLTVADWNHLVETATTFCWLGSLGNRSRRGFGALFLEERNGKNCSLPEPSDLLPPHLACAIPANCQPSRDFSTFATNAGNWLRDARRKLKDSGAPKADYFGRISEGRATRLASPILLRPWRTGDDYLRLLLIGRRTLVEAVAAPQGKSSAPTVELEAADSDPVQTLLGEPFVYASIAAFKTQVQKWQAEGQSELVQRFVELTQEPKYGGLRQQPWYPKL